MIRLPLLLGGLLLAVCLPLAAQNRDFQTQRLILDDDAADGTRNTLTVESPLVLPQNTVLTIPDPGSSTANFLLTESLIPQSVNADITFDGVVDFTGSTVLGLQLISDGTTIIGNGLPLNAFRVNMAHPNTWLAPQTFNSAIVNGGAINSATIGGTTPAPALFTTLGSTGSTELGNGVGPDNLTVRLGTGDFTITGLASESSPTALLTYNGSNEVRETSIVDLAATLGNSITVATDATLLGDGSGGSPLGLDLSSSNSWSSATTFGDGDAGDATTFNTGAGTDLVLGESGVDRSSGGDETFTFDNSGVGDLNVVVNGDITSNGDATINGDLSNTGNTTLATGAGSNATVGNITGTSTLEGSDINIGPSSPGTIDIGNAGSTTTLDGTVVFSQAPTLPLTQGAIFRGDGSGEAEELAVGAVNTVLTSDGTTPGYSLLDDDNIAAGAAIAGSKIDPDFGAQNLSTTGNTTLATSAGSNAVVGNTTGTSTLEGSDINIGPSGPGTIDIGNAGSTTTLDGTVVFSQAPTLPLTQGAILRGDGSGEAEELGVGSNGQVLTVVGGTPTWAAVPSGAVQTDATLTGDGTGGSPLGLDLSSSNNWTSATTLGNGDAGDATTFNTGAGTDLVLGESGVDRSNGVDETFTFDNSGAGDLNVVVNGDIASTGDLSVAGSTSLNGATTITGALSMTGSSTMNGAMAVNGTLSTTGNTTLATGAGSNATVGNTTGTSTLEGSDINIGPSGPGTIDIGNAGSTTTLDGTVVFTQAPTLPLTQGAILRGDGSGEAEELAAGSNGQVLTVVGGTPTWSAPSGGGWGLSGNAGTTPGTDFIGTTDNVDLTFQTNGSEKVRIEAGGDVGVGTNNPSQKLEVRDGNILLSNSGTAGELRFAEPSAGGTDYTAFRAASQTASVTYTLPAGDGTSGNVLTTNGSGGLTWSNPNQNGAVGSELFAAKGSDESITNNGTLQNDDDLVLSLAASTTYSVEGFLYARANSNNAELVIAFDIPTGATMKLTYVSYDGANNIKGGGFISGDGTASSAIDVSSSTSTDVAIWFRGLIRTSTTAGSVQLQWAQDSPGGGRTTTIETNSFMEAKRVE